MDSMFKMERKSCSGIFKLNVLKYAKNYGNNSISRHFYMNEKSSKLKKRWRQTKKRKKGNGSHLES